MARGAHLEIAGRVSAASLAVTGSPGLEVLAARVRASGRAANGPPTRAPPSVSRMAIAPLVVVSTRPAGTLVAAPDRGHRPARRGIAKRGRTRLVVKPHPAETADVYGEAVGGAGPSDQPRPARARPGRARWRRATSVVTVNSTVAIDAMALGIPAARGRRCPTT